VFDPGFECDGTPVQFVYNLSSYQAGYHIFEPSDSLGNPLDSLDWVAVFNDDICVGSRQWDTSLCNSGICDVPAMGDDGFDYSEGYMEYGDVPTFYVNGMKAHNVASDGASLQDLPPFIPTSINFDLTLSLVSDCNGDMGGAAVTSGHCGDCWGGYTGNEEDYMDTDHDGVCNEGSANGESDNCPNDYNDDQLNNDGDENGDDCDDADDSIGALVSAYADADGDSYASDVASSVCETCILSPSTPSSVSSMRGRITFTVAWRVYRRRSRRRKNTCLTY
jgi:hypothetical protein